jgi:hypothetical protein
MSKAKLDQQEKTVYKSDTLIKWSPQTFKADFNMETGMFGQEGPFYKAEIDMGIRPGSHMDAYFNGKIFDRYALDFVPLVYLGFVPRITDLNTEFESSLKNTDYYKGEYDVACKIMSTAKLNQQVKTLYKEDTLIKWSPQILEADVKMETNMFGDLAVKFSGKRTGDVALYLYPFLPQMWLKAKRPHFYYNRPSDMKSKYTLDLNGKSHVLETNFAIKNSTDFEYSWKLDGTKGSMWLPFAKVERSYQSYTSNDGKQQDVEEAVSFEGLRGILDQVYGPCSSKTCKFTAKASRIKHAERFHSGSRLFDEFRIQYTFPFKGYEQIDFSRKAALDGEAFTQANRASPVDTKLTWPGGNINVMEHFEGTDDAWKAKIKVTTSFDWLKKYEQEYEGDKFYGMNIPNGKGHLRIESMGGYFDLSRELVVKNKELDAKIKVDSSWIPKKKADVHITMKMDDPRHIGYDGFFECRFQIWR